MHIRDALKLKTGDLVACGPNDCGCDGSIVEVRVERHRLLGGVAYFHEGNAFPFLHADKEVQAWNVRHPSQAKAFARSMRRVE